MRRLALLTVVALVQVACVAPRPAVRGPVNEISFRGPKSGSQHAFDAEIEVVASVLGASVTYAPRWTNVHTGESASNWAMTLRLDEPNGQNEYVFTATGPKGEVVSERVVFLTPGLPADGFEPVARRDPQPRPGREPEEESVVGWVLGPDRDSGRLGPPPDDDLIGPPPGDYPRDPETLDPPVSEAEQPDVTPAVPVSEPAQLRPLVTWKLYSVIYNASFASTDQREGELQPPLDDGVFSGRVEGDDWSGEIEDASFGTFEFQARREASGAYRGQIRERGSDEWVPLLISPGT